MWEAMDDKPKLVDGSVISVYEAQFVNGTQVDHPTLTTILSRTP